MREASAPYLLKNPLHEAFRQELLARYRTSRYNCGTFVRAMHKKFPELRMVPGYYYTPDGRDSLGEHWWLQDEQGAIIDPTADQFSCLDRGRYVPYDPGTHLTVKGKCLHCGAGLVLRQGASACSASCAKAICEELGCVFTQGPWDEDFEGQLDCDLDIVRHAGLSLTLPDGTIVQPPAQEARHA